MGEVCVYGGCCSLSREAERAIITRERITADEFALAVLDGEGFEHPEYELRLIRSLKDAFVGRFGRPTVSVNDYGTPGTREHLRLKPPKPR